MVHLSCCSSSGRRSSPRMAGVSPTKPGHSVRWTLGHLLNQLAKEMLTSKNSGQERVDTLDFCRSERLRLWFWWFSLFCWGERGFCYPGQPVHASWERDWISFANYFNRCQWILSLQLPRNHRELGLLGSLNGLISLWEEKELFLRIKDGLTD